MRVIQRLRASASTKLALRRLARILLDLGVLAVALWLAFALRFDWNIPIPWMRRMLLVMPWVLLCQYLALVIFNVPRCSWQHFGFAELGRLGAAIALSGVLLLVARFTAPSIAAVVPSATHVLVPIGAAAADVVLAFVGLAALRAIRRGTSERGRKRPSTGAPTRLILVGAGDAGIAVARALGSRADLDAVAFVDDDPSKQGTRIHGVPVRGQVSELASVCSHYQIDEVLICVARANGGLVRRVTRDVEQLGLPVKMIPNVAEFVDGSVAVQRIRKVALEDLLRRDPVQLDDAAIARDLADRTVLVSGAGGSIGSELCRQVCRYGPRRMILVERSENALFEIHRELRSKFPGIELTPALVDITEREQLRRVFATWRPAVVIHAAAHKHVPMLEYNPGAGILNNVVGTRTIAELAGDYEAASFVMISTDKAVRPRSIMGASKRCAELLIQRLARLQRRTKYTIVRFGNVLGSNGSVVPIFKAQIANMAPVTVTHPDMERYFMTIPEASQLVLQAASMGSGGEIFILDMGEPVRILDLANDLIRLCGLVPGEDIPIEFTGLRPGEKLREELCGVAGLEPTSHASILCEREATWLRAERLEGDLAELIAVAERGEAAAIRVALRAMLPDFDDGEAGDCPGRATQTSQTAVGAGMLPALSVAHV
ncbi:UDP-N-acetylglucosamine 4,6-dehydratase [Enhygromyxa salina]|uniref:UDP-N-acetylglucosamine 4,6-dehydratase n=1 Tax=Enhygromyxa salina TaxID=215803 RepID=A0A0C1ZP68_9BACT|nr:nucleoside-diphosphate sugar epimerase/dehydratase [Enhygromyxa salina]KIG19359.1 UDP-N-acetylglucosamine 4,6-dehydratase [Enhygromyxa salina]